MAAPLVLRENMTKRVRGETDEVLQRATGNRKANSMPVVSGPTAGVASPSAEEVGQVVQESRGENGIGGEEMR